LGLRREGFVAIPNIFADTNAAIDAFGKNERVKKVFRAMFVAMTGLVLTRVLSPATAQQVVGIITSAVP
jgi:uncharacterized PurR-regulated membrane protein YhhQ (DUF165 family)